MTRILPRLTVSALGGDGGKTLVSLGLVAAFRQRSLSVSAYKKGPDYIDAAWLSLASGQPARNLDTYLIQKDVLLNAFSRTSLQSDIALIEGNRGLYDGFDESGTHSTAALARLLTAPIVLVLTATKVTRTLAALALGCKMLEPETPLGAIVLNQVTTARHESVARQSIEQATGIPVVGAIRRYRDGDLLPNRHLGLVTPEEHRFAQEAIERARKMITQDVDLDGILQLARNAPAIAVPEISNAQHQHFPVDIGVIRDSAFSFYYPENLEALEQRGAKLKPISSLVGNTIPQEIDALYIGGGFPETHAAKIAQNTIFLSSLKRLAENGLPIYAECGGLMLLSRSISWKGQTFPMAGVFGIEVKVQRKPAGHGYCNYLVDQRNPFFHTKTSIRGHEFHYSTVVSPPEEPTVFSVERGTGCFDKRDGLVYKNVLASYAHLHALGTPQWTDGFMQKARQYRQIRVRRRRPGEADL